MLEGDVNWRGAFTFGVRKMVGWVDAGGGIRSRGTYGSGEWRLGA